VRHVKISNNSMHKNQNLCTLQYHLNYIRMRSLIKFTIAIKVDIVNVQIMYVCKYTHTHTLEQFANCILLYQ
jgi:hypothetical protein